MAHGHLGLFDTPPNRQEIRLGLAAVTLQFVSLLFILPLGNIQFQEIAAFVPAIDAIMASAFCCHGSRRAMPAFY